MNKRIAQAKRIAGVVKAPGDKSISHRALLLGAIAHGKQVVEGLPDSDDVASTIACLRTLGCFVEQMPDGRTLVLNKSLKSGVTLNAGNSGTTARLLAGLVAGLGAPATIDGDPSLRRRPMKRVVLPLVQMGAGIETTDGRLPLTLTGGELSGITYELPVASAQVKSAILIAGLMASGETTVLEPSPSRDHTENLIEAMGATISRSDNRITVTGGARLEGQHIVVPGDVSSAAFFLVAATCLPDSEVYLPTTGVNPRRIGVISVLQEMGARITLENPSEMSGEHVADVGVQSASLSGISITDPARIVSVIDEIPILAVAATRAEGRTEFRAAGELRHKETDRIEATAKNLSALGAKVETFDDGLAVEGPCDLFGTRVSSYGDHRMAMAMAIAALWADGETEIEDAGVADVSYPGFYDDLRRLTSV